MAERFYSSQSQDGSWTIATMIEVLALPERMDPKALSDLIADCNEWGMVELLVQSGPQKGEAKIHLLLRMRGEHPVQIQQRMDKSIQAILSRMKYSGIEAVHLSRKETEIYLSTPGGDTKRLLCVPEENPQGVRFCYCPGGYSLTRTLDIPYLFSVLSEYSEAGISLQIQKSYYTQAELQCLYANKEWIHAYYGNLPEGQVAAEIFSDFLKRQNTPLFFITLSAWGEADALSNLEDSLRRCGYELLPVSEELFYGMNYLTHGGYALAYYAKEYGHVLKFSNTVPAGLERMNYLTGADGIHMLLQGVLSVHKLSGVKTSDARDVLESVPPQFLEDNGLVIGESISMKQRVSLPLSQLTKHMVVAGMPGSGKTTLMFWLMHELSEKNIPFLAVEPTKTEYRELIDAIPDLKILTPGRSDINPIMFNPFLPPKGITLEQFLPSLIAAFQMAFSMTTPLDVIFPQVLRDCYASYGWRNNSTSDSPEVKIFGMNEFIRAFNEEAEASDYDRKSKSNLKAGGSVRLRSLINANPYLFDTDRSLSIDNLLQGHTVIELDGIDNVEQKSLFLSLLLLQLKLVIRKNQIKDSRLKNVILIDEAHVLLDSTSEITYKNEANPAGKIREYLLDMVKVNRAYGTGMIFSDQSLAVLKDFVNNANVKAIMHVESDEEREFVTRNLNLSYDTYKKICGLKTGEYYLCCEDIEKPFMVMGPDTKSKLNLKSDIDDKLLHRKMDPVYEKPFIACRCRNNCDIEIRTEAEFIARNLYREIRKLRRNPEALDEYMKVALDEAIYERVQDSDQEKKLSRCTKMMVQRMVEQEVPEVMYDDVE